MPDDLMFNLWSNRHKGWWRAGSHGYVKNRADAAAYTQDEAVRYVVDSSMCGQLSGVTCMVAAPENWHKRAVSA